MSRYPNESTARFDQQFRESPAERNEARREMIRKRQVSTLQRLIADLSDDLRDEGCDYSPEGLDTMRKRVANALPPDMCPDWLARFRDPAVVAS